MTVSRAVLADVAPRLGLVALPCPVKLAPIELDVLESFGFAARSTRWPPRSAARPHRLRLVAPHEPAGTNGSDRADRSGW